VHTISNEEKISLIFLCICAPAWVPSCFTPAEQPEQSSGEDKFCIRRGDGKDGAPHNLLADEAGAKYSVGIVKINSQDKPFSTLPSQDEGSIYLTKGEAKMSVKGSDSKALKQGDLVKIPAENYELYCSSKEELEVIIVRA
jgi:mannose-6-phosphate isomerase-like protein (cupin superfamily)